MADRFSRYAEGIIDQQCSLFGAISHMPDTDANGWDRYIEFPPKGFEGPADLHPPPATAYVQVKSSVTGRRSCRLKLSNARAAANSKSPWFLVLIIKEGDSEQVYVRHIWKELIEKFLQAVRTADAESDQLHKRYITVSFSDNDRKDQAAVVFMREAIDGIGKDYDLTKSAITRAIGYDGGVAHAQFTAEFGSLEDIRSIFLYGSPLSLKSFEMRDLRFGVP